MQKRTDKTIAAIRAKYIGTAEEHELLKWLEDSSHDIRDRVEEEYRDRLEDREKSVLQQQTDLAELGDGKIIDLAVFQWQREAWAESLGADDHWLLGEVVAAMRGRGLTPERLRRIAETMEQSEPKAAAEREEA